MKQSDVMAMFANKLNHRVTQIIAEAKTKDGFNQMFDIAIAGALAATRETVVELIDELRAKNL